MQQVLEEKRKINRSQGKIVQSIFVFISVILLITLPILKNETIIPFFWGILLVITLVVLAALTSVSYRIIHAVNAVVSILGVVLFEFLTFVTDFETSTGIFLMRQIIVIGFLFALYFSIRMIIHASAHSKRLAERQTQSAAETKSNNELLEEMREQKDLNR